MDNRFTAILIELTDGSVAQMDVLVDATKRSLSADGAVNAGFELDDTDRWVRPDTDEMIEGELIRGGFSGLLWKRITQTERNSIQADRTFRDALKMDLTVDMAKAREIHKNKLRRDRAPLLAALDVEAIRADEEGDTALKADVVARKRALRDITTHPGIDAAKTPEELKAITI